MFGMGAKTDARKLDGATQGHLRRLVVKAVRGGMKQTEAAQQFAVSLRAVNKWVALGKMGGLRALKPRRRGRRAGEGRLDAAQSARIRALIAGHAGSAEVAVLPVDACGGGEPD